MDIVEAINSRRSIRAFRSEPVPKALLAEIIGLALRAPSWANTQPWEFAIVSGSKLEEIGQGFLEKLDEEPTPDIAGPQGFSEPYESRFRALAKKEFEIKGIRREDRERRGWWRMEGVKHYGAPCVIYICIDRSFYLQGKGVNVWPLFDCGLVAENIMLLAASRGLGTVAQAQAVAYPEVIRRVLGIAGSKLLVLGIAIGYPDWDEPITQMRSDREPLDKVAKWYGFEHRG
jgi:nitroreductase